MRLLTRSMQWPMSFAVVSLDFQLLLVLFCLRADALPARSF